MTTRAELAGISRAALYRTHRTLKDAFDRALRRRRDAGEMPDPREARIATLKQTVEASPHDCASGTPRSPSCASTNAEYTVSSWPSARKS